MHEDNIYINKLNIYFFHLYKENKGAKVASLLTYCMHSHKGRGR